MNPQASVLRLIAYGVVAANKPLNSFNIEVSDMEVAPMLDGELTDNLSTLEQKGVDADGVAFQSTVRSSSTVTARWLAFGSNRKTAPDVRRGEKVSIWRFGDADAYYWSSLEYDGNLRKRETVIYSFSNTTDEKAKATENNTYYVSISTHTKTVQFHTSISDGEPYGYDFIFNTKEGNVLLTDTVNNSFFLNSDENQLVLKTSDGAYIELIKKDLNFNIPGNAMGVITGNFGLRVGGNSTINTGGNLGVGVGGSTTLNSQGNFNTQAPAINFVTPKFTTSAILQTGGQAIVGGSLQVGGGLSVGAAGGGGVTLNGSITATGAGTFSGRVTASNIN